MSQSPQLYTVKVTETGDRVHTWHNLTKQQVDHIKATIWRAGCLIKRDDNTQELVSPYMLKEVLIIVQKGEVSGTMDNITNYGKTVV
jgi:hypothetical protein